MTALGAGGHGVMSRREEAHPGGEAALWGKGVDFGHIEFDMPVRHVCHIPHTPLTTRTHTHTHTPLTTYTHSHMHSHTPTTHYIYTHTPHTTHYTCTTHHTNPHTSTHTLQIHTSHTIHYMYTHIAPHTVTHVPYGMWHMCLSKRNTRVRERGLPGESLACRW